MRVSVSWLRKSALADRGGDEPEQHEHHREAEHEHAGVERDALEVVPSAARGSRPPTAR